MCIHITRCIPLRLFLKQEYENNLLETLVKQKPKNQTGRISIDVLDMDYALHSNDLCSKKKIHTCKLVDDGA